MFNVFNVVIKKTVVYNKFRIIFRPTLLNKLHMEATLEDNLKAQ